METRFDPSRFLDADYDEAMDELEKLDEELDLEEEENPVKLLKRALKVSKSLFESGDFAKIADARTRGEAGDLLYETVDELRDVEEVKERVGQAMREFVGDFEGLEEEGEDLRNRPEVPEDASDDFGRYSLLMNFLVSPIIDIVERYGRVEDPLEAFIRDVHLDVTPISDRFDDLQRRVDLKARVTYAVELDIKHVLHMEDVVQRLKYMRFINPPEGIFSRFLTLRLIADEVLSVVEGRKKAPYEKFIKEVRERINASVHELGEGEEALPLVSDEVVRLIVRELKRRGLVRKKGNKISEA